MSGCRPGWERGPRKKRGPARGGFETRTNEASPFARYFFTISFCPFFVRCPFSKYQLPHSSTLTFMSSLRSSISGDDALADVDALDEVVGDDAMDVEHLLSRYGGSSSSSSSAVSAASSPRAPASMGVVGVHGVDDPLAGLGSTLNVAQREVTLSDTMNMRPAAAPRSVESVDDDGMSTVDHIGSDAGASTIYSYTTHRAAHGSPRSPRSVAPHRLNQSHELRQRHAEPSAVCMEPRRRNAATVGWHRQGTRESNSKHE